MNLEWIVSSCILILVVLAVRAALGNRISAGLRYALWGIVLVRLLLPVQLFTSPVVGMNVSVSSTVLEKLQAPSIYVLPVQAVPAEDSPVIFQEDGTVLDPNSFGYPRLENNGERVLRYAEKLSPAEVLRLLWITGCAAVLLAVLFSNMQFSARLRRVRKPLDGTGCKIPVFITDGLPSPCLFGVFKPAVYVTPDTADDPAMLRHVLAHEMTHYKHLDHIWSVLRSAALAVHWWNPLVWLAVVFSRRDGELACDAGALKLLGQEERVPYGKTLLALVTAKPSPKDLLSCATTMSGEKRSLRERILRISREPKQLASAVIAVAVIISLTAVCTFGHAADAPAAYSVQPLALSHQPDLNRDGVGETLQVLKKEGDTPEWRLEVNQGEDPVFGIWSVTLDETHGNCGTYFLYQEDGEDFLLSYMPKMQQGQCTYSYELFHFEDRDEDSDRPDNRYIDRENHVDFDINFDSPEHKFDPAEIAAFMEEVNGYIGKSKLLVNTNHWMLNLEEDSEGRLYDNILSALHHPGRSEYDRETLLEALELYAAYSEDHPDDTNSALGDFLAGLEAKDIGDISGQTEVTASELADLLRETASSRRSRFYEYSSYEERESWLWSEACWTVPLADGNTLYLDASGKNYDSVGLVLETAEGASAAFYESGKLHLLICEVGEPYPAQVLPYTPDLDHDGKPDQLAVLSIADGTGWVLQCRSNDRIVWYEEAYTFHPGWNALFLCRKDGEDYLLRYHPYMSTGAARYRYELFYLQEGTEQTVQENEVCFDLMFSEEFAEGHEFDPKAIAAFLEEVNALLADSVQLLNTDSELLETFQREGRLYDSFGLLLEDERDPNLSTLENLLVYRNQSIAQASIPNLLGCMAEISADDLQNLPDGEHRSEIAAAMHRISGKLVVDGRKSNEEMIYVIPISIRQENPNNSEMHIDLEATATENLIRVRYHGWNTVRFYSENPDNDGTYLTNAPYEISYYLEDAELYQTVCGWGISAGEMSGYGEGSVS
ncbi:MAG: M56 family metallopeptidase [Oscillospiraceae bacterium]|nr:M56 family metallopeptidase [Oscillospiraceae bacterium]